MRYLESSEKAVPFCMLHISSGPDPKRGETPAPRVAVFGWYIPNYRVAVFRKLECSGRFRFTFCAPKRYPGAYLNIPDAADGFNWRNIKSWRWRIPGTRNSITFQPHSVLSMLRREYDVHVLPNDLLGVDVWLNLALARLFGRRCVLWGHGISRIGRSGIKAKLRRLLIGMAHACIFYTEETRDEWIGRGVPAERLFVAFNALDTDTQEALNASTTTASLTRFREENNLSSDLIVFVGRLLPSKNPEVLVRAMRKVVDVRPNAQAVIIGDGPLHKSVAELRDSLGLKDQIRLLGPIHDEQLVASYMLCSNLSVMARAAGLVIQHSFAYGVPIIIGDDLSSHGVEHVLVIDGITGYHFRDGDTTDLADKILTLLRDRTLRETMSRNCRAVIREQYNTQNMAKGIFDAIAYSIARPNRRKSAQV